MEKKPIRGVLAGLEAQWRRQVLQDGARGAKAEGPVARGEIKRDHRAELKLLWFQLLSPPSGQTCLDQPTQG